DAIMVNQAQFELFPGLAPADFRVAQPGDEPVTWIMLIHRAEGELRCELSLPVSVGDDGRVNQWRERILLRSIPFDPVPGELNPLPEPQLGFDVEIRRRA